MMIRKKALILAGVFLFVLVVSAGAGYAEWRDWSDNFGGSVTISDINCPNETSCHATKHLKIGFTMDGGITWQNTDAFSSSSLREIDCLDPDTCWVGNYNHGKVYRTTDGETYTYLADLGDDITGISAADSSKVWVSSHIGSGYYRIYHTPNGEDQWQDQYRSADSSLLDIMCYPNQDNPDHTCIAVGTNGSTHRGVIVRTENGGDSWSVSTSDVWPMLISVTCPSNSVCYAVGKAYGSEVVSKVLKSTDGGITWSYYDFPGSTYDTTAFYDISCPTTEICRVVGEDGLILKTEDGGPSWSKEITPTSVNLVSISCANWYNCLAGGISGTLLKYNDTTPPILENMHTNPVSPDDTQEIDFIIEASDTESGVSLIEASIISKYGDPSFTVDLGSCSSSPCTLTSSALDSGDYTWEATVTDNAGNINSLTDSFGVSDVTSPEVSVNHFPKTIQYGDSVEFSANASDPGGLGSVEIYVDYPYPPACKGVDVCSITTAEEFFNCMRSDYIIGGWESNYSCSPVAGSEDEYAIIYCNETFSGFEMGQHDYCAVAIDKGIGDTSNIGFTGEKLFDVIDSILPTITSLSISPETPNSSSTITFTAEVEDNADVDYCEFYLDTVGGSPNGTAFASSAPGGSFFCNYEHSSALGAGPHEFYVKAFDVNGNVNTSDLYSFNVEDVTSPEIIDLYYYPSIPTIESAIDFTAEASDDYDLGSVSLYIDGILKNNCIVSGESDSCTFSVRSLSMGNHNYYAVAEDSAGNSVQSETKSIYVGGGADVSIDSISPAEAFVGETVSFSGLASLSTGLNTEEITNVFWISNKNGLLNNSTTFETSELDAGTHTITFGAETNYTVTNTTSQEITVSATDLTASVDSINPQFTAEENQIKFNGTGFAAEVLRLNAYEWRSNISGLLTLEEFSPRTSPISTPYSISSLPVGNHTITLKVRDEFGQWSDPAESWVVVAEPPTAESIDFSTSRVSFGSEVTFTGSGSTAMPSKIDIVEYEWASSIDGFLGKSESPEFNTKKLSIGKHNISLKVKDSYGGWSEPLTRELSIVLPRSIGEPTQAAPLFITPGKLTRAYDTPPNFENARCLIEHDGENDFCEVYMESEPVETCVVEAYNKPVVNFNLPEDGFYWYKIGSNIDYMPVSKVGDTSLSLTTPSVSGDILDFGELQNADFG
ncbi:MAG: hypothetical protein R6U26_01895, partial [Candidatus Undinarchaeales archaeon]